ncbi:MAG: sortase [Methanobrevibacter sp.]|uniref:class E sortase n=1 Tax=Methanobrevibacter sp. TaxID=66852 RepID=UPI001AFE59D9|nr:sortase [Methanobrevibacter sp.]MBO5152187.1 sortase [Methanobrevibacter sp.]
MKRPTISTIIIIVCICIIGLYAAGEVNYFSAKTISEKNITSPVVIIEKVGIHEKINNVSLSQGVMMDEQSSIPTKGDVMLFGHRTLQGSPFLRLNEVNNGDIITLEWPGIGEAQYKVINKSIVPATYQLSTTQSGDHVFLITCDPIGSTANRLILEGELVNVTGINENLVQNNPQESYAFLLTGLFLIIGLVITFIYPKDMRPYILATVLIITVMLVYFCFNPISSQFIYDNIIFLNGGI